MRGIRVLEIDSSVASGYCTKLLAGLGADVVCVEPSGGAALRRMGPYLVDRHGVQRSALWEYLGAGKRSVVNDDDAALDELLRWADVIVSSCDGADLANNSGADRVLALHCKISALNPDAVHTVVSGYGLTGPYRDWHRSDLTDWAAGGYLFLTGDPHREPLQGGGPWASYMTGATAAIGSIVALMDSCHQGKGQLVDVGAMEALAGLHQWTITMYSHLGYIKKRWGNLFGESHHPIAIYPCKDGSISIVAVGPQDWEALCVTMELWHLLGSQDLEALAERFDRAEEIDAQINAWLAERTVDEALALLQAAGVPANRLLGAVDVLQEEQLEFRKFWVEVDELGDKAKMPDRPFAVGDPIPFTAAPTLGAHSAEVFREVAEQRPRASRPVVNLKDVRVLEFGVAWAGPLAGRFLGDLGADVIKVEHPLSRGLLASSKKAEGWRWGTLPPPQVRAQIFPDADPGGHPWNRSGLFNKMNRSKRSVALDAKTEAGKEVLAQLIGCCDMVLYNYTPSGARSLGVDAERVATLNPRAITVSLSGYGMDGPLADNPAYGPVLQSQAGLDEATGYDDSSPIRLGVAFPDAVGGVHGAFAALAALWEREVSGTGQHVDLSQFEALLSVVGDMLLTASITGQNPRRHGNRSEDHAPQGVYECSGSDSWLAMTVQSDEEWRRLLELIEDGRLDELSTADLDSRRANSRRIDEAITKWTRQHASLEAATILQGLGMAACPAFTNAELFANEQLRERGFIVSWDQADVGVRSFPGFPIHFKVGGNSISPAPPLGGHNLQVLHDLLGMSEPEVDELQRNGVFGSGPLPADA